MLTSSKPTTRAGVFVALLASFALTSCCVASTAFAEHGSRREPTGRLEVIALPEGSKVHVDGELVGVSPLADALVLPVGEHRVKVQKRGFAPHSEDVTVRAGRTKSIEAYLPPIHGILRVTSNVDDADVLLDGESLGNPPIDREIEPGERLLRVTSPGQEDFTRTIELVAGEPIEIEAVFEERRGSIHAGWFWATSSLSAALFVTGIIMGCNVLVTEDAFNQAQASYEEDGNLTALYNGQQLAEQYDRYRSATNVLFITASIIAAAAVVLALFTWRRRDRRENARSRRRE